MSQTFNPESLARGTDKLQVDMVRYLSDGVIIDVATWLPTQTEGEIHALRPQTRDGLPSFVQLKASD
jgi:hypothetical protein